MKLDNKRIKLISNVAIHLVCLFCCLVRPVRLEVLFKI